MKGEYDSFREIPVKFVDPYDQIPPIKTETKAETSSAWLRSAQRSSVKNLTQICFAQKSLSAGIGSEKVSF